MLHAYIYSEFIIFFLIFLRLLGLASFMPFLSQTEISPRFRLMAVLGFAYLITPTLAFVMPSSLSYIKIGMYMVKEFLTGAFIGLVGRLLLSILDVTGTLISAQIGLSSATSFNPSMQGSTVPSVILMLFGIAVFLNLDLHHVLFKGFVKSYALFPVLDTFQIADMSQGFMTLFSKMFWFGIQLSLPFMIVFVIIQIAFGLMNRMIPQMQVFFIALPFQLWVGLTIFCLIAGAILMHFGTIFENEFTQFFKLK